MNSKADGHKYIAVSHDGKETWDTALILSAANDDQEGCWNALAQGASLTTCDRFTGTALMTAICLGHTALATWLAEQSTVEQLDFLHPLKRCTAIDYAIEAECAQTLRLLTRLGADLNHQKQTGTTLLMSAA